MLDFLKLVPVLYRHFKLIQIKAERLTLETLSRLQRLLHFFAHARMVHNEPIIVEYKQIRTYAQLVLVDRLGDEAQQWHVHSNNTEKDFLVDEDVRCLVELIVLFEEIQRFTVDFVLGSFNVELSDFF